MTKLLAILTFGQDQWRSDAGRTDCSGRSISTPCFQLTSEEFRISPFRLLVPRSRFSAEQADLMCTHY